MRALRRRQAPCGQVTRGNTGAVRQEMPGSVGQAGAGLINEPANPCLPSLCRSQRFRQSPGSEKAATPCRAARGGQSCSRRRATGWPARKRKATRRRTRAAGCRKGSCGEFKTWCCGLVLALPFSGCPALLCLTFCSLPSAPFFKIYPGQQLWPQNLLPHRHRRLHRHRHCLGHRRRAARR